MKKFLHYAPRVFLVLFGLVAVLYLGVIWWASANKQRIINEVNTQLSERLNGNVSVGKVELSFFRSFPQIAVLMEDFSITDTMYRNHGHAFLEGRRLFLELSIPKLIRKKSALNGVHLKDARIYLYTDSLGYSNTYLLKSKKEGQPKSNGKGDNELRQVFLENVHITLVDMRKNKKHELTASKLKVKLDNDNALIRMNAKMQLQVKGLGFKLDKGSYLRNQNLRADMALQYDRTRQELSFQDKHLRIGRHPFQVEGKFNFSGKDSTSFTLGINTSAIAYEFIRQLVPERTARSLGIVKLDKPLDATVSVNGPPGGGPPLVNIRFTAKNTSLATPFMDFEKASFNGSFTNEVVQGLPRRDSNSRIALQNLQASWHDIPVTAASIVINNLKHPELICNIASSFPVEQLNAIIGSSTIVFREGNSKVNLYYKGPLVKNDKTNSFLNGTVQIRNGTIWYEPREVELKNLLADITFKNSDLYIDKMSASVLNHTVNMQGHAKNLLTLINTEPNKVNISWNIQAPFINLGAFTYLLNKRKQVARKEGSSVNRISGKIDDMLDKGRLDVTLSTNKLTYKSFVAHDVHANVSLLEDRYIINQVVMGHAGGKMSLAGALVGRANNSHHVNVQSDMDNVDVRAVFKAFGNFGQDAITAESLEGKLTSKVQASLLLDNTGAVIPSSLESVIDFSLKNGGLNNYEPVKKLQRFVFKKRDFENIRFAEIHDRFVIRNGEVTIQKMEIQSNVLSLFVEGVYSNRGNTDISIQVPLSNLKKRDEDYNPENIGVHAKRGRSIFLRGRPGPDGSIKFKLDLFNKYGKNQEEGK